MNYQNSNTPFSSEVRTIQEIEDGQENITWLNLIVGYLVLLFQMISKPTLKSVGVVSLLMCVTYFLVLFIFGNTLQVKSYLIAILIFPILLYWFIYFMDNCAMPPEDEDQLKTKKDTKKLNHRTKL